MLLWKWKNGDHNFTVWQKLRLYNYKEGRKGLALFQIISILKFYLATLGKSIFKINELSPVPRPFSHMAKCL